MKLSTAEFRTLYTAVFNPANEFPGYRPNVMEAPDGDWVFDKQKHYAHVATKYLAEYDGYYKAVLTQLLHKWTDYAVERAIELGFPMKWWPSPEDSTIRIQAYPPGADSAPHYDFDLFTLFMYRNLAENYECMDGDHLDRYRWVKPDALNADAFHYGELATLINENYRPTKHQVHADAKNRTQYAAVFFAMPRLDLTLPGGLKVQEWLDDRKWRSRKEAA